MNTTELQQAVLHLSKQERAHLVHLLLDSLDELPDADIRQEWLGEAGRRAQEIDQGKVQLIAADELEQQVQELLK